MTQMQHRSSGWPVRAALACVVLVAMLTAGASRDALASHYRLPADGLVSDDEHASLTRAKVHTTVDLLERAARVAAREALAKSSGLSLARLTTLACQVDLLRVKGLGPSMVRLLHAAGIRHTRDLKGLAAAAVLDRMRAANSVHEIAPVLPQEPVIADWISQAVRLEWLLEGTQ